MNRNQRRRQKRKVAKQREKKAKLRGWTEWTYTKETVGPDGQTRPIEDQGFQFLASNGLYHVMVRLLEPVKDAPRAEVPMPEWLDLDDPLAPAPGVHLSIRRNDRGPIRDWRHLQRIKNELLGEEWEGAELYPAESRKVDAANQYHLWCFPFRIPFGYTERDVSDTPQAKGAVQRPGAE